jgi:DNA repair protein RecO (recombination protein O)
LEPALGQFQTVPRTLTQTKAVLLRRTEYRDTDLYLVFMTEDYGKLKLLARGARNSRKRFGGALEPMHELGLELEQREQAFSLQGAQIVQYRSVLTQSLERMQAASRVLKWVREVAPEAQPEPLVWNILSDVLRRLNGSELGALRPVTTAAGLQLLDAFGWALDLDCCVRCGKQCPAGRASAFDPVAGGLVCSSCGGARYMLSAVEREQLSALRDIDTAPRLDPEFDLRAQSLVDAAFAAHALGPGGEA